jgi:hypothetical protein
VWAQVNLEVAEKNKTLTMAEVKRLMNIELHSLTRRLGFLHKTHRKFKGGKFCKINCTG